MHDFQIAFILLVSFVVVQRIVELRIADRNTKILLKNGGLEFGKKHYWVLVLLHTLFFLSLITEAFFRTVHFQTYWPYILTIFLLAQVGRIWVIRTMNGRWTTRIIVLPGKNLVDRGPFRILPHPNYFIVAIEIFTLPFLFKLYWTACIFSVLNAVVLLVIRIPEENRALRWAKKMPQ